MLEQIRNWIPQLVTYYMVTKDHITMHTQLFCKLKTSAELIVWTVLNIRLFMNCIAEKFSEFGKSSMIDQTKTIQISTYN